MGWGAAFRHCVTSPLPEGGGTRQAGDQPHVEAHHTPTATNPTSAR